MTWPGPHEAHLDPEVPVQARTPATERSTRTRQSAPRPGPAFSHDDAVRRRDAAWAAPDQELLARWGRQWTSALVVPGRENDARSVEARLLIAGLEHRARITDPERRRRTGIVGEQLPDPACTRDSAYSGLARVIFSSA